jgi:hypothetical protein
LQYLCASHFSVLAGDDIHPFLRESETLVHQLDEIVRETLGPLCGPNGSLAEITRRVLENIGGEYELDVCSVLTAAARIKRYQNHQRPEAL